MTILKLSLHVYLNGPAPHLAITGDYYMITYKTTLSASFINKDMVIFWAIL